MYFKADNPDAIVEVFGAFSKPPWITKKKMTYSSFFSAFTTIVTIRHGSQFKFVVNSHLYCTSPNYLEINDGKGNINNVFTPGLLEPRRRKRLSAEKLTELKRQFPHVMSDFEEPEIIPPKAYS